MTYQFSNDTYGELEFPISNSTATARVTKINGQAFPTVLSAHDPLIAAIINGNDFEIVHVTANQLVNATVRQLSMVRAQQNTTGTAFAAGSKVIAGITAEMMTEIYAGIAEITDIKNNLINNILTQNGQVIVGSDNNIVSQ